MAPMFPRSVLECTLFCFKARRKRLERERSVERNARRSRKKNHEKKREGEGLKKITSLTSSYGITGGNNSKKVSYGSVHSNNR